MPIQKNRNDKIKPIETKQDAIFFLNQLIVLIYKRMQRLKNNIEDINAIVLKYENENKIPTKIFHRYSERLENNTKYLANLFGDETKDAVSYKQFRKILEKKVKQGQEEFELDKLSKEMIDLLNNCRDQRNWSHHVPQSLLNSQIQYISEFENIPKQVINNHFTSNQILISIWEYHEIQWLYDLQESGQKAYDLFSKIFQRVKKDYSKLVGESMNITKIHEQLPRPYTFKAIPIKSLEINTKRRK